MQYLRQSIRGEGGGRPSVVKLEAAIKHWAWGKASCPGINQSVWGGKEDDLQMISSATGDNASSFPTGGTMQRPIVEPVGLGQTPTLDIQRVWTGRSECSVGDTGFSSNQFRSLAMRGAVEHKSSYPKVMFVRGRDAVETWYF